MFQEDELLMISGIQHYDYCKRQWALIHMEQIWAENLFTKKGEILHEKVDDPFFIETRGDKHISRSMPLLSRTLGFYGIADAVEFIRNDRGIEIPTLKERHLIYPVEYKAGKPKESMCDRLQLCVQAMCLEEMYQTTIEKGFLYYGKIRHREEVWFDEELRALTIKLSHEMHDAFDKDYVFPVEFGTKCAHCSLYNQCAPQMHQSYRTVTEYISSLISEAGDCQ